MKREIYCPKCKVRVRIAVDDTKLPPGEHVKYVDGKAKKPMVCDFCNEMIYPDQSCTAFSNYVDGKAPYEPWEHEFIEIAEQRVEIKMQGVYGLLITGDEEQLIKFHIGACMTCNFLERRENTIHATCFSESLELAAKLAQRLDITMQYIDRDKDDNEIYPVLNKGTHPLWEKGGYVGN